jgi:prepilin-type N-terminal cleavage/methylation domain-containing protein
MRLAQRRQFGFTLIELMITLSVILVIMLLALPSFRSFQQRAAVRAAANQAQSFWNQARFEAAKQNRNVVVGVKTNGALYCLGANSDTTSTSATDPTTISTCDCFTAGSCDVAAYPGDQSEWREVTLNGIPTLGGDDTHLTAVIEPKRTSLLIPAEAGTISFKAPKGRKDYRLNLYVDQLGRAQLCESTDSPDHLSDFQNQSCAP